MQTLRYLASSADLSVQKIGSWFSLVAVSGSLAFALNGALAGWTSPMQAAPPAAAMQWITLSSADRSVACLSTPDRFGADALELHAADMDRLAADLGCQT